MSTLNNAPDSGFILNVNKPIGKSSYAVVSYIKRLTGIKKVGHAGTLDPFAEGVLLVAGGRATKQISDMMKLEKEYRGTVRFGLVSDTYDNSGAVTEEHSIESVNDILICQVLEYFRGTIEQVPPPYSAIKYKGKPLYSYARKGTIIIPKQRYITVYEIQLESFNPPDAIIRVVCSKGTYIRSIAHDLGRRLGCGAILIALTRLRIGNYNLEDAITWENMPKAVRKYSCVN
jgi:tRNA pseudouridine55 synthase